MWRTVVRYYVDCGGSRLLWDVVHLFFLIANHNIMLQEYLISWIWIHIHGESPFETCLSPLSLATNSRVVSECMSEWIDVRCNCAGHLGRGMVEWQQAARDCVRWQDTQDLGRRQRTYHVCSISSGVDLSVGLVSCLIVSVTRGLQTASVVNSLTWCCTHSQSVERSLRTSEWNAIGICHVSNGDRITTELSDAMMLITVVFQSSSACCC